MASRNTKDCCSELREIIPKIIADAKAIGIIVVVYCTWRSIKEQMDAVKAGLSKRKFGAHNYVDKDNKPASEAFDFYIDKFGKPLWSTTSDTNQDGHPDYIQVGEIGKKYGLEYGGDWETLKDYDHLQIKGA